MEFTLASQYTMQKWLFQNKNCQTYFCTNAQHEKVIVMGFVPQSDASCNVAMGSECEQNAWQTQFDLFFNHCKELTAKNNKHLPQVHEFIEENNTLYVVSKPILGVSVADYVRANGPMSYKHAIGLLLPLLAFAQNESNNHVFHLFLPDTVFLSNATLYTLDFGAVDILEKESPEGEKWEYSFVALLYTMVMGRSFGETPFAPIKIETPLPYALEASLTGMLSHEITIPSTSVLQEQWGLFVQNTQTEKGVEKTAPQIVCQETRESMQKKFDKTFSKRFLVMIACFFVVLVLFVNGMVYLLTMLKDSFG